MRLDSTVSDELRAVQKPCSSTHRMTCTHHSATTQAGKQASSQRHCVLLYCGSEPSAADGSPGGRSAGTVAAHIHLFKLHLHPHHCGSLTPNLVTRDYVALPHVPPLSQGPSKSLLCGPHHWQRPAPRVRRGPTIWQIPQGATVSGGYFPGGGSDNYYDPQFEN